MVSAEILMAFSSPGDLEKVTAIRCKDSCFLYLSSFQKPTTMHTKEISGPEILGLKSILLGKELFFRGKTKVTCSHTVINVIYQMWNKLP